MGNPEAVPRVRAQHIRALEKRRNYLLSREASNEVSDGAKSYHREERKALDVALAELRVILDLRLAGL